MQDTHFFYYEAKFLGKHLFSSDPFLFSESYTEQDILGWKESEG